MEEGRLSLAMETAKPTLYSFRRCPYAIRARMAIVYAGVDVDIVEVSLRDKPQAMLNASCKGTVPVLCDNGTVIDESVDIMLWALKKHDPEQWLAPGLSCNGEPKTMDLIRLNDLEFKPCLDKYKYASRHPEFPPELYRQRCDLFLSQLESLLQKQDYLLGERVTLVDVAILPFVRQFSMVEPEWFCGAGYTALVNWLDKLLASAIFVKVMEKPIKRQ